MNILLVKPRGFCAGVNMAIECLEESIRHFGPKIYVYHEIVHNRHVVERFIGQGVTFVTDIADVPPDSILLYSAHGIAPEIREQARQRNLRTIDATCPLVTKVHIEAVRFARAGYHIILIGHEGHDEVIGTMGEVPKSITLIGDPNDVDRLSFSSSDKLAYLTQTTLSLSEANQIIERLEARYPNIQGPPKEDICYATTNRQEAIVALAPRADIVIVLGSQNSSNSRRLMEIGESCGKPSFLIDSIHDLDYSALKGCHTVLITAGASAPEIVVEECVDYLVEQFGATVVEQTVREEHVRFLLPQELRTLQPRS